MTLPLIFNRDAIYKIIYELPPTQPLLIKELGLELSNEVAYINAIKGFIRLKYGYFLTPPFDLSFNSDYTKIQKILV